MLMELRDVCTLFVALLRRSGGGGGVKNGEKQQTGMEETVRSLLQNQGVLEQTAVDTVDIMKAYKDKLPEEVQKQHDGPPPEPPDGELDASQAEEDRTKVLVERLKALEDKNSALALENENQREQYERCLDEVANQVVQALLTQKDLREECVKLRTRVFDLEQQNRALGILFQQRIKPASDLLLQKLHSRILDLSAADLLLEPERSRAFLLAASSEAPVKLAFPMVKCLSQLSLAVPPPPAPAPPPPPYPRSSCSSSELSLSSACSEFSSGSYTWNEGRSCGKSSLTWEKRLSLGSSAPGNICGVPDEPPPTRRKESHILEGLRKLQRRKHRSSSSSSSKVSKSGYKDCMNSNEGIYSLGVKGGGKAASKAALAGRTPRGRNFSYDSDDDADDELARSGRGDHVPTKDGWFHGQRRSHSISDSLCSWEGTADSGGGTDGSSAPSAPAAKQPPGYDSKERPEKLLSFINSFLPEGRRPSAFSRPSKLHRNQSEPPNAGRLSGDRDDVRPEPQAERDAQRDAQRPSRDAAKMLAQQCLRSQGRTQSADGRPRPFSFIKAPAEAACTQSEESVLAIFDADGEPIELRGDAGRRAGEYAELLPDERPTRQKAPAGRNYAALETPEKPCEFLLRSGRSADSRQGGAERLSLPQQRRLIKPPSSRANKGLSIPPMNEAPAAPTAAASKANGSKIPGRNKATPTASPLKVSKGCSTEPAPPGLDRSPSSAARTSRFVKPSASCSQSPKPAGARPGGRGEWGKTSSASCSPHLSRRHLDYAEQPTRDKHCDTGKSQLRSPSPPPPPGRTTSLLVRPNYEGSPQAHKPGPARGPPPSYHTSLAPNMQSTLPIKDKDGVELDAGYGTALAPQRLADRAAQHLHKAPPPAAAAAAAHTPTKGTSKRATAKDYLPPANSGCPREPDGAPKSSKNVPPPYGALRGSSLQTSFAGKRGSAQESAAQQAAQKASISLPLSLQDPPGGAVTSPSAADRSPKSRIPMGFKAFLKSPSSHKNAAPVPGKQEKDHINSVSKETVSPPAYGVDSPVRTSAAAEAKGDGQGRLREDETPVAAEEAEPGDKAKRSSQLFGRSISVTTKPHLKPALGMNGAKARSQSFGANYMEKPGAGGCEGAGKVRTQIITNSGERGNSLSRQSSLEVPADSPLHSPRSRLSHYGGMTAAHCQSVLSDRTSACFAKAEGPAAAAAAASPSQKEARGPPEDADGSTGTADEPHPDDSPASSPSKTPDGGGGEEKRSGPASCTIEEKVMMGIEENLQKCQEQEKVAAGEAKHKSGPSLANWFGLRKSKLPALGGKKAEPPRAKDDRKEPKTGSVLAGKQRKDKKKEAQPHKEAHDSLSDVNSKLTSIMDHCNNQMGHIASHIHCGSAFIAKEQLVKELLGRTAAVKGNAVTAAPPPEICRKREQSRADAEICGDTATLLMSQKMSLQLENEGGRVPDAACQDHVIGSASQMRTLDSGIGTFPLPDPLSRAGGRHLPRSEETAGPAEPPALPDLQVPSPSKPRPHAGMAHSLSDPAVTCGGGADAQSRLPKPASSDAIRLHRRSVGALHSISSSVSSISGSPEHRGLAADGETKQEPPGGALRVCTYPGSSSSSDTETETGSAPCSPRRPALRRTATGDSGGQSGDTLTRSEEASLSIMELYRHDVLSQFHLLHSDKEIPVEKPDAAASPPVPPPPPPSSLRFSLESPNKLKADEPASSSTPSFSPTLASRPVAAAADPAGSLSDSLYDSFSSCTSQGSNEV